MGWNAELVTNSWVHNVPTANTYFSPNKPFLQHLFCAQIHRHGGRGETSEKLRGASQCLYRGGNNYTDELKLYQEMSGRRGSRATFYDSKAALIYCLSIFRSIEKVADQQSIISISFPFFLESGQNVLKRHWVKSITSHGHLALGEHILFT